MLRKGRERAKNMGCIGSSQDLASRLAAIPRKIPMILTALV
jgi:hypothetical protein